MIFEAIKFVLERLSDLIKYEAKILLVDEKVEIESLQRELELIESYLKDIDEFQRQATVNHVLQTKVQHLMQILPEIENFLDTITYQKAQQTQPSCSKVLKRFFSCTSNPLILKHSFVKEITRIRENLCDTLQRPETYQLPINYPQVTNKRTLETNYNIIEDEIIIGVEKDVNTLVSIFVGKHGQRGANLTIVGMGGSGKTTLARMFYNHKEIMEAFPRRAWVCVSQDWKSKDLLLQICAKLDVKLSENERSIAKDKLQKFLERSSCLVVLDDVWERSALQDFLPTLLSGNGRVLITTRNEEIGKFQEIGAFYIHRARRFTREESWELFSRTVINSCEGMIDFKDDDFVKLGREMIEKCEGLPLAIVTLAGILGTKAIIQEWEGIKDNVISKIMEDDKGSLRHEAVKKVLELSYIDLPYYLKPCFLYLGTFREDDEIEAYLLINLWIDEGFVKPDQCPVSRRLKEVAKNFLDELVQRCMVQVVSRDYAGEVSSIRIHDLMRDLCIDKAKNFGFFQVLSSSTTSSTHIKPPYRAIIHNRRSFVLDNPRLRTLICTNADFSPALPKELFPLEMFKQLRVLYLQRVELGDSVEQIGNMVLLRHLRLWECRFTPKKVDFPKKLRNLQTFVFYGELKLSDHMFGSMEQLRVLLLVEAQVSDKSPELLLGVDKLRNLQKLVVLADEWMVKELHAINMDLRELKIYEIRSQTQLDSIYGCVSNGLTRLENLLLDLHWQSRSRLEFDFPKMKLERCQHLKALYLEGKIKKIHEPWLLPPKLLSLCFVETKVGGEEDKIEAIARLYHLRELALGRESYKGDKLILTGLPQLQKLYLHSLSSLKECIITQGSLTQLRELGIDGCDKLERIPDGISNIKTLQHLMICLMSDSFCKRLEKKEEGGSHGGEDFHLVQHIPTITFASESLIATLLMIRYL